MEEAAQEFGEMLNEGSSAGPQYTAEELEAQTTSFLLAFIEQMQVSEEHKARLRSNVIDRAMHPEKYQMDEDFGKKGAAVSPEDIIKLVVLVSLVLFALGFFGYKLYKSIMEKEQKVKKNKKEAKKEKKVNSPPASPRSKKEK